MESDGESPEGALFSPSSFVNKLTSANVEDDKFQEFQVNVILKF